MVHAWISLQNDKINGSILNKRVLRIFRDNQANFYGDYELDIYIGTKHDYSCLEHVISKVISISNGWIYYMKLSDCKPCEKTHLSGYISDCGFVPENEFRKMFPHKENYKVIKGIDMRKDGNFIMRACETNKFYYVICFATS